MTDPRPRGFWNRGTFRLVRIIGEYTGLAPQRNWVPPGVTQVTWARAVRMTHLQAFHATYRDQRRQTLKPCLQTQAWAVPWIMFDAYVHGRSDVQPVAEEFDPARHCFPADEALAKTEDHPARLGYMVCFTGAANRRNRKPNPPQ